MEATGFLRIIRERYIEKKRTVYVIFIDLEQEAFDSVQSDEILH